MTKFKMLFILSLFCFDSYANDGAYFVSGNQLIPTQETEFMKRALRNLPFARRGYVFKSKELQAFYEKLEWFIPNPNYVPDINILTEREREWIKKYQ